MKIRTTQPKNNKYYIRQVSGGWNGAVRGTPTISGADVLCNCVGYANGRFNEIIGKNRCVYQLVCNAENFIESAQRQGLKISAKPVQGGIMVWQKGATLGGGDGAGHVAVVEEVYEDGSILTSESGWASWAFKNVRRDNSNGRWGQSQAYHFRGCIINPAVDGGKIAPTPKLIVDGIGGPATVRALQEYLGTPQDGIFSGQNKQLSKYYPALLSVSFGKGGSLGVKKLQKWIGVDADGVWGKNTSKALQKKLGVEADGIFGTNSMKALQKYLNKNLGCEKSEDKKSQTKKKEPKHKGEVIDVSYVQKDIDWEKVKADGVVGAIIRCGFRGYGNGKLCVDEQFEKHIKGAHKAGLKIGVYFFTEAINAAEGKEEAAFTLNQIKRIGIPIDYPIAIDTEYIKASGVRANNISKAARTAAVKAFCKEIKAQGYEPMIYASLNWFATELDMSQLPYKIWCAQYNTKCDYKGSIEFWQYTSTGKVDGISGVVDINKCYYKETTEPKKETKPEQKKEEAKKSKGQEIADTAKSYVGKSKYVLGGTNIKTGVDCTGFVTEIYRLNGIKLTEYLSSWGESIGTDISKAQPGDIISYKNNETNKLQHHSIYIGNNEIVHAANPDKGIVKTNYKLSGKHIEGIRRPRKSSEKKKAVKISAAEIKAASNAGIRRRMVIWANEIAKDNRYHYNRWMGSEPQSHKCPICSGLKYEQDPKHFGWNCIGFGAAVWRHGGGLKNICKCGWISGPGGTGEYLLSAKTDADALKLAKKYIGLDDIEIIRSKTGIPKSQWQAGDICLRFIGDEFNHVFVYLDSGRIADATGSSGTVPNDQQIAVRSNLKNYYAKVIIRYTGGHTYLSEYDRGEAVKKLQTLLNIEADGIFGAKTKKAVEEFQEKHGLKVDGLAGSATLHKLYEEVEDE